MLYFHTHDEWTFFLGLDRGILRKPLGVQKLSFLPESAAQCHIHCAVLHPTTGNQLSRYRSRFLPYLLRPRIARHGPHPENPRALNVGGTDLNGSAAVFQEALPAGTRYGHSPTGLTVFLRAQQRPLGRAEVSVKLLAEPFGDVHRHRVT